MSTRAWRLRSLTFGLGAGLAFCAAAPVAIATAPVHLDIYTTRILIRALCLAALDPDCVAAVRGAVDRLGHSLRGIVSGAGHDACWIARVAPTAMIMVPCVGGLFHNEAETITPASAVAGANVLMHAVLERAGIVE